MYGYPKKMALKVNKSSHLEVNSSSHPKIRRSSRVKIRSSCRPKVNISNKNHYPFLLSRGPEELYDRKPATKTSFIINTRSTCSFHVSFLIAETFLIVRLCLIVSWCHSKIQFRCFALPPLLIGSPHVQFVITVPKCRQYVKIRRSCFVRKGRMLWIGLAMPPPCPSRLPPLPFFGWTRLIAPNLNSQCTFGARVRALSERVLNKERV